MILLALNNLNNIVIMQQFGHVMDCQIWQRIRTWLVNDVNIGPTL